MGGASLQMNRLSGWAAAVPVGAALAVVPFAIVLLLLRESEDPESIGGYLRFWRRVPGELFLSFVPMAAAGAMLGWIIGSRTPATSRR